jgi:adenylate kinase
MRLLLIGPPGSGKGTQAKRLAAHYDITHIASGDLLRHEIAEETAIGRTAARYVRAGDLVPDDVVMDMLRGHVEEAGQGNGYILDGFPRTVAQAQAAYLVARSLDVAVQIALYLEVPREELLRRMHGRGAKQGRADDTDAVMHHRLDVFEELTSPLLEYYSRRETLLCVPGDRAVDEVTATMIKEIDRVRA